MKMTVDVDLSDAFDELEGLQQRVQQKLKWAAWQGVELLREEMKVQAPRSQRAHWFYSRGSKNADGSKRKYAFQPGDLRRSLFAFYDKNESEDGRLVLYQVGWRHNEGRRAKYADAALQAVPYGYMVHNGVNGKNRPGGVGIAGVPFTRKALAVSWGEMERRILNAVKEAANGKTGD